MRMLSCFDDCLSLWMSLFIFSNIKKIFTSMQLFARMSMQLFAEALWAIILIKPFKINFPFILRPIKWYAWQISWLVSIYICWSLAIGIEWVKRLSSKCIWKIKCFAFGFMKLTPQEILYGSNAKSAKYMDILHISVILSI